MKMESKRGSTIALAVIVLILLNSTKLSQQRPSRLYTALTDKIQNLQIRFIRMSHSTESSLNKYGFFKANFTTAVSPNEYLRARGK